MITAANTGITAGLVRRVQPWLIGCRVGELGAPFEEYRVRRFRAAKRTWEDAKEGLRLFAATALEQADELDRLLSDNRRMRRKLELQGNELAELWGRYDEKERALVQANQEIERLELLLEWERA